ncbi:glutaminase A [Bacillus sp. SCS-151]|uniref:glutaminase A n=1 Tax=Nanhaiella sioensis TaxID=3115293 RepID=UPI00397BAD42
MACKSASELERTVNAARECIQYGNVAAYIPALAKANKEDLAIALYYPDGTCNSAGDVNKRFTLQSISKVISLALALMEHGEKYVFSKVGMEPTGDPFHSIAKLETTVPSKPLNPMINAGALAVTNMISGNTASEQINNFTSFVRKLTGGDHISYSSEVADSEFHTAYLNRSLGYYMKEHGIINGDIERLLDVYTKQCAININCIELAKIALVFAFDGTNPYTGERIIPAQIARICKTFMVTCGMYNASGEFAIKIGLPAKSGVSGGILAVLPNKFGIGIYGPSLDDKGNSIAGLKMLEILSTTFKLSIF